MWGWLKALVEGIVTPLVQSWQQYQHGRASQQRDDAQATLKEERTIHDALEADRAGRKPVDADELRRQFEDRAARDRRPEGR